MDAMEVNRYLELVDRRLFILVHSGVDWIPEYGTELEAIDKELVGLRELVDQEHERKERMDVIKAIESYPYYHDMTGQGREEWNAWRVQACEEWALSQEILEKGAEEDGSSESGRDYIGNDGILSEPTGDCGQGRGEREHYLQDTARVPGEDGQVRKGLPGSGDIPGERN